MTTPVSRVTHSDLAAWLASISPLYSEASYNKFLSFLDALFDIAIADRVIARSPFNRKLIHAKKIPAIKRYVPTEAQFQAVVDNIRIQREVAPCSWKSGPKESADFAEFLGLAGVGQAEALALDWADVDWEKKEIRYRRKKTRRFFTTPIYGRLRPLLDRLHKAAGHPKEGKVLMIKALNGVHHGLKSAVRRLGYPPFTQRSLRAMLIGRLWKAGVDIKQIAKWQGHNDGGKLIISTYTEVFGSDDGAYEELQRAKADA
jgi:integrase